MAYIRAMRKADAIAFFGNNQSAVARAIGITRASVNGWPEIVPLEAARAIEIVTHGKLRVNESLYARLRAARRLARQVA